MYPFFVDDEKIFSFSYKPIKGDLIRDDDTGKFYEVTDVAEGRKRKVEGRITIKPEGW